MKRRFIKGRVLLAWLFKSPEIKKDIYAQIEETIAERRRILPEWEKLFLEENHDAKNDIHIQLKETIAEFRQSMRQHEDFFSAVKNKQAA
jgi:hypothetical protein